MSTKMNHKLSQELRQVIGSYILLRGDTKAEDAYSIITALSVMGIELARLSSISLETYQGAVSTTWTKMDQEGDKNNAN